MSTYRITAGDLVAYESHLRREERSSATVIKYLRNVRAFVVWLDGTTVTKETVNGWKEHLLEQNKAPATINAALAALNSLFCYLGWVDCRARFLKIQRRMFRDSSRDLTRMDYEKLISHARALGRERLALLMETICATGIRVSEVRYITVETVRQGRANISMKGKLRVILIPRKLCRKLLQYAKKQKNVSGEIFLTVNGKSLSRRQIWAEMKCICKYAGVEQSKVFPHNLRHLFATVYYRAYKDIAKLADILGHSCIETTRFYLLTSDAEHREQLEHLQLVT